jgi:hypothetical protein
LRAIRIGDQATPYLQLGPQFRCDSGARRLDPVNARPGAGSKSRLPWGAQDERQGIRRANDTIEVVTRIKGSEPYKDGNVCKTPRPDGLGAIGAQRSNTRDASQDRLDGLRSIGPAVQTRTLVRVRRYCSDCLVDTLPIVKLSANSP